MEMLQGARETHSATDAHGTGIRIGHAGIAVSSIFITMGAAAANTRINSTHPCENHFCVIHPSDIPPSAIHPLRN